jgi:hypothetical protein
MKINPMVIATLEEHKIDKDAGLLMLLGVYFGLDVEKVIPEEVISAINLTKIIIKDYGLGVNAWTVDLFEQPEKGDYGWVKDWVEGFGRLNKEREGSWRDAISRMQNFFYKYPEYTKEDVIAARNLYFRVVDKQYLMKSHKFIFDGVGVMQKSTLLEYCEKIKQKQKGGNNIRGTIID